MYDITRHLSGKRKTMQATHPLNINTGPITKHEIKTALKNRKNGKAAGVDNIPLEVLKAGHGGQTSVDTLQNLVNYIWDARLKSTVDGEEQACFRRERSCTDLVTTLPIIIEESIEFKSSLYLDFVDFEKAVEPTWIVWGTRQATLPRFQL